jgi:hypothetical protein
MMLVLCPQNDESTSADVLLCTDAVWFGLVHDSENHLRTLLCPSPYEDHPMRTFRCTLHPIEHLLRDYSLGVILRQFDAAVDN